MYAELLKSYCHLPKSHGIEQRKCCVALQIGFNFRLLLLESILYFSKNAQIFLLNVTDSIKNKS